MAPSFRRKKKEPAPPSDDAQASLRTGRPDMAANPDAATDDSVCANLKERHAKDAVYTRIGPRVLVSVNPHKQVASNAAHNSAFDLDCLTAAASAGKPAVPSKTGTLKVDTGVQVPPHVFEMASSAYMHMISSGEDQVVVFSGESGSGKTEASKLFLQQLIYLNTRAAEDKSHLPTEIYNSQFVLEAFGNAGTLANRNASRFNRYVEVQYDVDGTIAGAKLVTFSLESWRIPQLPAGEKPFHVFDYLLAGATHEEKSKFRLGDRFAYLGGAGSSSSRADHAADTEGLANLRLVMKTLGLTKKVQTSILQTLSAILHLGNVEFARETYRPGDQAYVKNREALELAAELMEVGVDDLESALTNRSALVGDSMCTDFLDPEQARDARDGLVTTIYSLLFTYLVEHINTRLANNSGSNFVGIVDFAGFENSTKNVLQQLINNYAAEKLQRFAQEDLLDAQHKVLAAEGLPVPDGPSASPTCLDVFDARPNGIIAVLDEQCQKATKPVSGPELVGLFAKGLGKSPYLGLSGQAKGKFSIKHYAQPVMYDAGGLLQRDRVAVSADYLKLFRAPGGSKIKSFLSALFSETKLETQRHPKNAKALVGARRLLSTHRPTVRQAGRKGLVFEAAPPRTPLSVRAPGSLRVSAESLTKGSNPGGLAATSYGSLHTPLTPGADELSNSSVFSHFRDSLDELVGTFREVRCWFVFCINPNSTSEAGVFKDDRVRQQIQAFELTKLAKALSKDFAVSCTFSYFLNRYKGILMPEADVEKEIVATAVEMKRLTKEVVDKVGWTPDQIAVGNEKVLISEALWRSLEGQLDSTLPMEHRRIHRAPLSPEEKEEYAAWEAEVAKTGLIADLSPGAEATSPKAQIGKALSRASLINIDINSLDEEAVAGTAEAEQKAESPAGGKKVIKAEQVAKPKYSFSRRCWMGLTTFNTFWIPEWTLIHWGKMKREDVRQAWREKVSLNIIVLWLCALLLFFVVGLGALLCPKSNVYSTEEVKAHDNFDAHDLWMSWNGYVYDMSEFYHTTGNDNDLDLQNTYFQYKGQDVSKYFPRYNPADLSPPEECTAPSSRRALVRRQQNYTDEVNARCAIKPRIPGYCHDTATVARKIKYGQIPIRLIGPLAFQLSQVQTHNTDRDAWMIVNDRIYDITMILNAEEAWFGPATMAIFENYKGRDASVWASSLRNAMPCLEKAYFMGVVDRRNQVQCAVSVWITYGVAAVLVSIMVVRFLAAMQLSSKRIPEDLDKYTICMVPCYTEGEESLRKTIDSLALLSYVDDRKLLFVVADGMIRGSGNEKSTPEIVLQIFGVDMHAVEDEHPALDYVAIGEGSKQHNKARVYSGFYSVQARSIPFVVVVKCGLETETNRPGNRGKRDSQMVLMRFLNKVHHRTSMTPMELEIYRQIQVNIGVDPWAYEFVLMVDADTEVMGDSLNRLVSCMMHDTQVMGICGETRIANEKSSLVTMMQVYEYYISHHLAKAFESLFGNVTCLPGCFSMYRIRTTAKAKPLLIASELLEEYSVCKVDTLHKKNLLSLGEDRYLTTLMLKHFPDFRNKFTPDAHCMTVVPDKIEVLLSQRRRWINSTIHNQYELLLVGQLCGFLCFSMRFVVALDLFATLTMPAAVAYLCYLIYASIQQQTAPTLSLIMLAVAYGLQMIIFIIKRKFEHIGWMLISIVAMPFFNLFLPLYSFWHFDDFSWGNTRRVAGSNGKEVHVADTDSFDPAVVPTCTWEKYVQDITKQVPAQTPTQKSAMLSPAEQDAVTRPASGVLQDPRSNRLSFASPAPAMTRPASVAETNARFSVAGSNYAGSNVSGSVASGSNNYGSPAIIPVGGYPVTYSEIMRGQGQPLAPLPEMVMMPNGAVVPGMGMVMPDPMQAMDLRAVAAALPTVAPPPIQPTPVTDGGMPSDDEIVYQIRVLLSTHDLQSLTKKKVREELTVVFGLDMAPKKQFIGQTVEAIINGEL
ncbi:chitin synthase-domain-containing protein [Hyaloraphidium curvatum]|nr:chitin synthase-domain-containing protein [Hyaloraphidium curvatum]